MQTCVCDLGASHLEVTVFTPFLCTYCFKGGRSNVVIQSQRLHNLIWLATRNQGAMGRDGREQLRQSPRETDHS